MLTYRRGQSPRGTVLVLLVSLCLPCLLVLTQRVLPATAATGPAAQTHHSGAVYVSFVKRVRMPCTPIMGTSADTYLIVFIRVTNRGRVPVVPFGEREFAMTGAGGQTLDRQDTCGAEGYQSALHQIAAPALCGVNTGTLSPGQSLYGSIVFRAPRHQHHATLVWTLDDSRTISAHWSFTY